MKSDDVILGGGVGMMMVDDGGGRGVKNGRKSDDVINGRPLIAYLLMKMNFLASISQSLTL